MHTPVPSQLIYRAHLRLSDGEFWKIIPLRMANDHMVVEDGISCTEDMPVLNVKMFRLERVNNSTAYYRENLPIKDF